MWFLLFLVGGGYLAYRHYHHDSPPVHGPGKLTLSAGEIHAYGGKLLLALAGVESGRTTAEAVAIFVGKTPLDVQAIAHSAKQQGADPASVDETVNHHGVH